MFMVRSRTSFYQMCQYMRVFNPAALDLSGVLDVDADVGVALNVGVGMGVVYEGSAADVVFESTGPLSSPSLVDLAPMTPPTTTPAITSKGITTAIAQNSFAGTPQI